MPSAQPALLATANRKMSAYQPKVKTKFVQWEKLNRQGITETIWDANNKTEPSKQRAAKLEAELAKSGVFDEIEKSFAQKQGPEFKIKTAKQVFQIIDSKKAYNLNIFIGSLVKQVPFDQIKSKLLSMDSIFDDEQLLANLIRFEPSEKEKQDLLKHQNDSNTKQQELSIPDRFCLDMSSIERYHQRLESMLFKVTFQEKIRHVEQRLDAVFNASKSVKNATSFTDLLTLASINKLSDTKSDGSAPTLLHYIIKVVQQKFPDLSYFLVELRPAEEAQKVVILSETMTEYKELEDGLKKLDTEIQQQQKLSDSQDNSTQGRFLKVMKDFQREAAEQFTKVESLCQEMCEAYDRVVRYFGENPEKMLPDEFFGILSRFRTNWQNAATDLENARLKKERLEKQMRLAQERKNRPKKPIASIGKGIAVNTYYTDDESDTAYLDELMENLLQSGGREVRIKKRHERGTKESNSKDVEPHRKTSNADSITLRAQSLLSSMREDDYDIIASPADPLKVASPIRRKQSSSSLDSSTSEEDGPETTSWATPRKSRLRQFAPAPESSRRASNSDAPSISRPLKSARRQQSVDLSISQATRTRRRAT
ncbi:hypothetical protein NQZ79_g408 [Umbelopsis isabellina]|nr:hypothetical protein NQZ79_g408 [Umbelopsis isabellina]